MPSSEKWSWVRADGTEHLGHQSQPQGSASISLQGTAWWALKSYIEWLILGGCPTGRPGSLWDSLQPLAFGPSTKHCFFHINPITPLCADAWSCLSSCSFSTYERCRWCNHSYLLPKCHGYSLPGTVEQLLNLCHNEVVNTIVKLHEYSHQNNSTEVPRDQGANWKLIYTVVWLNDGSEQ